MLLLFLSPYLCLVSRSGFRGKCRCSAGIDGYEDFNVCSFCTYTKTPQSICRSVPLLVGWSVSVFVSSSVCSTPLPPPFSSLILLFGLTRLEESTDMGYREPAKERPAAPIRSWDKC